jgi:arylsulfatase A-like enzyme
VKGKLILITLVTLASVFSATGLYVFAQQVTTTRLPNILLIISDDIGLDVMSNVYPGLIDDLTKRYGSSGLNHPESRAINGRPASTPNLSQLARQGIAFTNAWAQPFCSPTRASILTGLFAYKANVLTYADPLAQSYTSFVKKLKDEAGYSTGIFGKWHLAGLPTASVNYPGMKPKEAGFEIFKGNMHAAIKTYWDYEYQIQDANTPAGQWRGRSGVDRGQREGQPQQAVASVGGVESGSCYVAGATKLDGGAERRLAGCRQSQ